MSYIDDNNRHCGSCKKVITDFTQMSDPELLTYFSNNAGSCGKFSPQQLNRDIQATRKTSKGWLRAAMLPAFLAVSELCAQDTKTVAVTEQHSDSSRRDIQIPIDARLGSNDTIVVKGNVIDATDSSTSVPLVGAVLMFGNGAGKTLGCVADQQGNFEIKLDSARIGDTIDVTVRYLGYEDFHTEIVLTPHVMLEPMVVRFDAPQRSYVVGDMQTIVYHPGKTRIRTFFWRLVHPRSWFRRH